MQKSFSMDLVDTQVYLNISKQWICVYTNVYTCIYIIDNIYVFMYIYMP